MVSAPGRTIRRIVLRPVVAVAVPVLMVASAGRAAAVAGPAVTAGSTPAAGAAPAFEAGQAAGRAAATTISACSFAKLASAVGKGGVVKFGVNCPDLVFTKTLAVTGSLTVDLEANGHQVVLDGGGRLRLFEVTGGTLTINGMTLQDGLAAGKAGTQGRDGLAGSPGANGSDGAGGGLNTSMPGGAGTNGIAGGRGATGAPGKCRLAWPRAVPS